MLQCVSAVALMVTAVSIVTSGEDMEKKGINVTLADDTEQEILDDSALLFKNGHLQINGSCKQAMFQAAMALFFKPDAIIHMPSCLDHDKWYRRQCVDSLGICWCATPQGTPIAGSQKRGTSCSAKTEPVDPVCPNDQNTHRCNFLTCTMTMCPATGTNCHVNPCGGCKREYIKNHMKTEYDCFKGFSTCGKKMLEVLNSHTSQEKMKVISRLVALHLIFGMGNLAGKCREDQVGNRHPQTDGVNRRPPMDRVTVNPGMSRHPPMDKVTVDPRVSRRPPMDRVTVNPRVSRHPLSRRPSMDRVTVDPGVSRQPLNRGPSMDRVTVDPGVSRHPLSRRPPMDRVTVDPGISRQPVLDGPRFTRRLPTRFSLAPPAFEGSSFKADVPQSEDTDRPPLSVCNPDQAPLTTMERFLLFKKISDQLANINETWSKVLLSPLLNNTNRVFSQTALSVWFNQQMTGFTLGASNVARMFLAKHIITMFMPTHSVTGKDLIPASGFRVCNAEGSFDNKQCSGVWCWCVNKEGRPTQGTLTTGHLECDASGDRVAYESDPLYKCKNGRIPAICSNSCVDASCPNYPAALCFADPCDNCKISFFVDKRSSLVCSSSFRHFVNVSSAQASSQSVWMKELKHHIMQIKTLKRMTLDEMADNIDTGRNVGGSGYMEDEEMVQMMAKGWTTDWEGDGGEDDQGENENGEKEVGEDDGEKELGEDVADDGEKEWGKDDGGEKEFGEDVADDREKEWGKDDDDDDGEKEMVEDGEEKGPQFKHVDCKAYDLQDQGQSEVPLKACPYNVCMNVTCDKYPEAICLPDPQTCQPKYYDIVTRMEIQCNKIYPVCQRQRAVAVMTALVGGRVQLLACTKRGTFKVTQCNNKKCWCVNEEGKKISHGKKCGMMRKSIAVRIQFELQASPGMTSASITGLTSALRGFLMHDLDLKNEQIKDLTISVKPNSKLLHVQLTVLQDGSSDMSAISYYLRGKISSGDFYLNFDNHQLMAAPGSMSAQMEYRAPGRTKIAMSTTGADGGKMIKMVIPVVVCVVFALVGSVVGFCMYQQKRQRTKEKLDKDSIAPSDSGYDQTLEFDNALFEHDSKHYQTLREEPTSPAPEDEPGAPVVAPKSEVSYL